MIGLIRVEDVRAVVPSVRDVVAIQIGRSGVARIALAVVIEIGLRGVRHELAVVQPRAVAARRIHEVRKPERSA